MAITPYRVSPEDPVLNGCLFAEPGGGKTTLAASCQDHPAMADVLFANVEGGLLSISHRQDIHAVDTRSTAEVEELYWALKRGEFASVKTVVIDSATELQTINLEEIVSLAVKANKKSRTGKLRTRDDIWQDDYGKSTTQLKRIFRWFKDLEINVILTALAKTIYPKVPEGTDLSKIDPISVQPSLTAKLMSSMLGYMDFVWYMRFDPETNTFQALTRRDPIFYAKTRGMRFAEALPPVITLVPEGPDRFMMPEIYNLFCKTQSKAGAPAAPRKKTVIKVR